MALVKGEHKIPLVHSGHIKWHQCRMVINGGRIRVMAQQHVHGQFLLIYIMVGQDISIFQSPPSLDDTTSH